MSESTVSIKLAQFEEVAPSGFNPSPQQEALYKCGKCGENKPESSFYKFAGYLIKYLCKSCKKEYNKTLSKEKYSERKIKALCHYSKSDTPFCLCCGETGIVFLCLDHINNWGKKHRQEMKESGRKSIYTWLYYNNYPDIPLRVLCANCNQSYLVLGHCAHSMQGASN